jgi:transposase
MLTREDDIDVHALRRQGWTISAIARHLGRDRKTIRAYLAGNREAGVRARSVPGPFEVFAPYCAQRLGDDPHLWASALFDELVDLGYVGSYPTMTRQIRTRGLRPACEPCRPATGRPIAVIDHPGGEETQWDWVELPDPPQSWGWDKHAHLLVGALAHSGAWRGVLCESEDQPHLVDGLDRITRALGGLTKDWRFDRMATVITPGTGRGPLHNTGHRPRQRGDRSALRNELAACTQAPGSLRSRLLACDERDCLVGVACVVS